MLELFKLNNRLYCTKIIILIKNKINVLNLYYITYLGNVLTIIVN